MQYYEHITKEGERWDLIAYQYYGNAYMYEPIVVANFREVGIKPILPSGLKIRVPVIDIKNTIRAEELPPWKRT